MRRSYSILLTFLVFLYGNLAMPQTGPAGVGNQATNPLWLRAHDITGISSGSRVNINWIDNSGNSHFASQSDINYQPLFITNALNGYPVIRFDGVDDFFFNAHSYSATTVFVVYKVSSSLQSSSELGQVWGNYDEGAHVAMDARTGNLRGFSFDGTPLNVTQAYYGLDGAAYTGPVSNSNIQAWQYDNYDIVTAVYTSGKSLTEQTIGSLYSGPTGNFSIGDHQYGGDIAEIIVFSDALNDARRIIVENYLSSKYNIDIAVNGVDFYSGESLFPEGITGIGQVSGDSHTSAFSDKILGLSNPADLDNDEFLFTGHDGQGISAWGTTELPSGSVNIQRLQREWILEETGDIGDITVTVDTTLLPARSSSYTRFVLLQDDDGDFSSGCMVYEMESTGADEYFSVDNIDPANGIYLAIGTAIPTIQFSSDNVSEFETASGTADIVINYIPVNDVQVDYSTSDGTALAGSDYTAIPVTTATISAGTQSETISFTITADSDLEDDEYFTVSLSSIPAGYTPGTNHPLTYIINDDDKPRKLSFSLAASSYNESDGTVSVQVEIPPGTHDPVNSTTVDYRVIGGTATGGGTDYTLAAGTVTIPALSLNASFNLTITDDPYDEYDETVIIELYNPVNGNLSSTNPTEHTLTINDNDGNPSVQFSTASSDGDESVTPVSIPVELSAISLLDVTIDYSVSGTATIDGDHDLNDGSVVIPAGDLSASIVFTVTDDPTPEPVETVIITINNVTNGTIGVQDEHIYTIIDNDADFGYSGPGGVGDHLSNELWLRADSISSVADGNPIPQWNDISGNDHHASQGTATDQPVFNDNVINNQPVVTFDGSNDFYQNSYSYSAKTVFSVYRIQSALQSTSDLAQLWGNYDDDIHLALDARIEGVFSFDGGGSTSARFARNGSAYSVSYYEDSPNTHPYKWVYDQFDLVSAEYQTTTSLNEQILGSLINPAGHNYGGDIAEILVYNVDINQARRNIVESYLAAKYGLAIASDKYGSHPGYNFDVAGIGIESSTDFHIDAMSAGMLRVMDPVGLDNGDYLLVGHNNAGYGIWTDTETPADSLKRIEREWYVSETNDISSVTIAFKENMMPALPTGGTSYFLLVDDDGDFTSGTSAYQLNNNSGFYEATGVSLDDGDYISLATNGVTLEFSMASSAFSEASGTVQVEVSMSDILGADVQFSFAVTGGTATGGGTDYSISSSPGTISAGNTNTFIDVTLTNDPDVETDEIIQIEITGIVSGDASSGAILTHILTINDNDFDGYVGPGGVGDPANNKLWLRTDSLSGLSDNDNVSDWPDFSGNNNDFSQINAADQPLYKTSVINGKPVVRFDGISDFMTAPDIISGNIGRTIFIIGKMTSSTGSNDGLLLNLDYPQTVGSGRTYSVTPEIAVRVNGNIVYNEGFGTTDFRLLTIRNAAAANVTAVQMFLDGVPGTVASTNPATINTGTNGTSIGWSDHVTDYFDGDMAEVIIYNNELNNTRRIIVENYLAAKYNIDISSGSHDYFAYQSSHPEDLAGIGQYAATDFHTVAQSAGILRISNASSLNINDYLLFAHDNGTFDSWVSNETPGDSIKRIAREWRFDETGDIGTVKISIEPGLLPAADPAYNYRAVWLDSDGDFTSGSRTIPLIFDGSSWVASNVDIHDGDYLTIGIIRPYVEFSSPVLSGNESVTNVSAQVSLNSILGTDVSVDYSAYGGTATGGGVDYTLSASTLIIPAGSLTAGFNFTVIDDPDPESDEDILIRLQNPSAGLDIGLQDTTAYTIIDNDNSRTIDFTVTSSSGSETSTTANLTVRLNVVDNINPTSVDYSVTGGTATGAGVDYTLAAGTATVLPGDISTVIPISVVNDDIYENDETIIITLSNPVNANLGANTEQTYTILNDDSKPSLKFEIPVSSTSEHVGTVDIRAILTNATGTDISFDYVNVAGGTATAGSDYSITPSTLTIAAGDTSAAFTVTIIDDPDTEPEETTIFELTNLTGSGAVMGLPAEIQHILTITDDDYTGFRGPGGVGDDQNNKLWLSADSNVVTSGTDVLNWLDLSGNANHAIALVPGQEPVLTSSVLNNRDVISFDDNGGTNGDYLGANISLGISGAGASTVFMVARNTTTSDQDNTGLFIGDASGHPSYIRHYGLEYDMAIRFNNGNRIFDDGFTQDNWKIGVIRNFSGALYGEYEGFINGVLLGETSSSGSTSLPATTDELYYLGAGLSTSGAFTSSRYFDGDMAEVIAYNIYLNNAQVKIVNNYLSSKYGLPVAEDLYAYDNLYGEDVAGIGREAIDTMHTAAMSSNILLISNAAGLDDNEYLMFGHNGDTLGSWVNIEVPAGSIMRIAREWRIDETGDPGELSVSLDTTNLPVKPSGYNNYLLLVDSDNDFSSGATAYPLTLADGFYTVEIDPADGDYFTFAISRPEIQFTDVVSNGLEGSSPVLIEVSLNFPYRDDIEVDYAVSGGSATSADFTLPGSSVTIPAGSLSATISLNITDDAIVETDETVIIEISNPSSGYLGANTQHTYTINDNDNPRMAEFTALPATGSGDEGTTPVLIEVGLSSAYPDGPSKIAYEATGGTATDGSDFFFSNDTLVIPAGDLTANIPLSIIDDPLFENAETIEIELIGTGSLNTNLGTNTLFTFTINDNDAAPSVSFEGASAGGSESFQTVWVGVNLSAVSELEAKVDYDITGITATGDVDFYLASGTLTIPAGETADSIMISIIDDPDEEPAETLEITLSGEVNCTLGGITTFTYTIQDDDGLGWVGPGGVANFNQNKVWLNASDAGSLINGSSVDVWPDVTTNSHDAIQTLAAKRPLYLENMWNSRPVVQFNSGLSQFLTIPDHADINTGGPYDKKSIIVSFRTGSDINSRQVLYEEGGGVRGLNVYIDGGRLYLSGWNENNDDGGLTTPWSYIDVDTPIVANTPYFTMLQFNFDGAAGGVTGWLNGQLIDTLPGAGRLFAHSGDIGVGAMTNDSYFYDGSDGGEDHYYNGYIGELIVSNIVYNTAQQNIVNNYLAAKYGISITNDYYDHNLNYGYQVFGIGQDNLQNSHAIARGAGVIRIDNPSDMDNGEYLLIGHNGNDLSWTDTNVPDNDPNIRRTERIWRADDRTNSIGTIRLGADISQFDPNPFFGNSTYVLITDDDGDFTNGYSMVEIVEDATSGLYMANNIDLSNDKYFTIGIIKPTIQFTVPSDLDYESVTPVDVEVSLNFRTSVNVTADISVIGIEAVEDDDFTIGVSSVLIPSGSRSTTIQLDILNDTDPETDERIQLELSNPSAGIDLGTNTTYTYTIQDDDNLRSIGFTTTTDSNDESVTSYNIEVTLDIADPVNPTTVLYEATGGTASDLGVDYTLVAGILTIPANNTTGTIPLGINNDLLNEPDETIVVTLSNPTNTNLGANQVFTYTIVDNDAVPNLSFTAPLSSAGAESFSPVRLYLELDNASGNDITVYYSSAGGTANNIYAGDYDYIILDESYITIPAGSLLDSLEFPVFNDIIEESDETVIINIDSVRNAVMVPGSTTFTYTIYDDDGKGYIGPGGVGDGSNYQLWLKTDSMSGFTDGDAVTTWQDVSGNLHDAAQSNGSRKPDYRDNLTDNVNDRPVVLFDGNNDGLYLADDADFNTGGPYTVKTLIASFETGADITSRQVIYEQGGTGRGLNIYIEGGQLYIGGYNDASDDATTPWLYIYTNTPVSSNTVYTAMLEFDAAAGEIRAYLNGNHFGTASGAGNLFAHGGNIGLGFMNDGSRFHTNINNGVSGEDYYFEGKILEFLSYNTILTDVQKNLTFNYFSSKYGHSVPVDLYSYDATHSYEVFGIGRLNSTSHIVSRGTGLVLIDLPQSLDEGDYLMIGHDNENKDTWTTSGLPAGYTGVERLARDWKIDKTNDIGNIRISIDTSLLPARPAGYDNYILFIDDDGDLGNGGTRAVVLDERYGNYVRKTNIDFSDGNVFFIGVGRNITVQDGNWNDPDTWLLNVPASDENVTVLHDVDLTANTQVGGVTINGAGGIINTGSYNFDITTGTIDTVAGGNINPGTGTVIYSANGAQCVEPLEYNNLTVSGAGTKTLCGDITVNSNLTIFNSTTILDADIVNNYNITLKGNWQSNGTFNAQNGKVFFDGTGAQSIQRNIGDNEVFYDFEIGPGSQVLSDHNIQVKDTLLMNGGNIILATGKALTIGESAVSRGVLVNNSGLVVGRLIYWLSSTDDDNRDIIYPVGTASDNRSFIINANNISTSGRLQVEFIESYPTDQGLPKTDGLFVVDETFNEGYWKMTVAGGLSISAAAGIDLDLVAGGFGSLALTENSRLLGRYSSGSNWLLNGTHVNVLTDTVRRRGMTLMTYEYAVGHVIECTPVFTSCPADISLNNDPGDCGAVATWTAPAPESICTALTVTSNYDPGDFFSVGLTEVVYYLWNGSSKVDSCKFNVEVTDNEDPVANCKDITVVLDATGNASIVPADVDNGSIDNCGIASSVLDITDFTCADQGVVPVTLTLTDNSGNTSFCVSNVTVNSSLNITTASLQSCNAVPGVAALFEATVVGGDGNYSYFWDGLDDSVEPFMSITLFPFSFTTSNTSTEETPLLNWFLPDGPHSIELTVTDGNGCTDTYILNFTKDGLTTDNISVVYSDACEGSTETYSVGYEADATYAWNVENGTIISAVTDTNEIDVTWDLGVVMGVVSTNITQPSIFGDCESSVIDTVTIHPVPVPAFTTPVAVTSCLNATKTYTLQNTYFSYSWTVTGGNILVGGGTGNNYVTVQWTSAGTGNVAVEVTTSAGCSNSVDTDVAVYDVAGSIDSQTNESCPGSSDGEVTVSATGGLGIHEVSIDGVNYYSSPHTFTGLSVGSYTLRSRDALGCIDNLPFSITLADVTPPTVICKDITVPLDGTGNASIVAADIDDGSWDACGIQSISIDISTFDCSDVGPNTVTLTVVDNSGNSDNCTSTVTIEDVTDPVFDAVPSDITIQCDISEAPSYAGYDEFTAAGGNAFDNCGIDTDSFIMLSEVSDGLTCPETYTRTYQISDVNGNTATCEQDVIINDITPPTISDCPSDITVPNDVGNCSAVVTWTEPTATDNCGLASYISSHNSGDVFPVGTTTVTYTATDNCGLFALCTFTVTVSDTESPTVDTPTSDISVNNDAGLCSALVTYTAPTFADNCDGSGLAGTMTAGLASGSAFPVGVTTVTYEYTDAAGNGPVTSSFTVTVSDTESPTVDTPTSDISVNNDAGLCSAVVTYTAPTFADNCDGSGLAGTMTAGLASGSAFPVGVTTVTYEYTDAAGNGPVTSSFTVTVSDTESPTVETPTSNISVNNDAGLCSAVVTYTAPTFADNCDGSGLSGTMTAGLASGSAFPVGVTTVTYEYTDAAGNGPVTSSFTVTVSDTESPTVDTPTSDISVNNDAGLCSALVTYTAPTFADNCDGSGLAGTMTAGLASGSAFPVGVTTVTYEYTDAAGNGPVTSSFTVTVSDTESPTVDTPTSDISVNNDAGLCSAVVTYTAPTFADNCDGSGLAGTMTAGLASGSAFPVGVTTVTYEYTDAAGNGPVTSSFTVTVSDTESPTVETPTSNISVNNDAGLCSAVVTYTAPTFADNCDGSGLAGTMTAGLASGSAFPVGVTTVTYEYTDAAGNGPVTSSFTVTVSDTESPTVDTPTSDISVNNDAGLCSAVVTYTAPTFADNCDGSGLSGTMTAGLASGSAFPVGVTTVTYEYTDAAGNGPVTSSFTVTVSDTESPTVETPTSNISVNNDAGLCSAVVTYTAPTFADNCDGSGLAGTMTAGLASGSAFPVGVTTVTYEYTDAAGNGPVTSSFTVTVSDTESPTVDTPTSDISVNNDAGLCSAVVTYTAPTFADNCDGSGLAGTMTAGLASGSAFPVGVTTVTYEYTDAAGNGPVTSSFTVTVSDTESPTVDTPTSDISVNNDAGLCSALVTYTAPTFADNCDGSGLAGTMTAGLASGSAFPVGVTTVTYEYTDAAGNGPVTSSFTVTVSDTESPTVDTPTSDISVNNDAGLCSAVVTYTAPTFADNCDGSGLSGTMTAGLASGSAFPVGVTTVTYEYTDAAGNGPVTSSFTVTVSDTESPTVETPTSNISVNNDAGLCSAVVTYTAPTFADNCDGSGLAGTMTAGLASGSAFPVGVTTVTYEYTDAAGNGPVTSSFTVTVSDTESPTVDTPTSDISVNNDAGLCSAVVTYTAPTFADNCDGSGLSGTMTAGLASGSAFPVGVTTVTYEYTDAAGNGPVTSSFTVTVSDTESPTVETPTSNISVNNDAGLCSAVVTYTAPTFADNCDGSGLSGTMTAGLASGSAFPVGVTTVTYEYTDAAGNGPVTSSFTVTVSDTESPTVETPTSNISVNNDAGLCSAVVTYTAPTFADNCDGSGLAGTMTAGLASGSAFPVGVTTVTYEYTDAAGNGPVTSSFTVTVSDTESPTVETPTSNISVNNDAGLCSAVVTYTAPTFADNCDGSGLAGTMTAGLASGSAFPVGVTTVTYEYTDAAGNGPVTSSFTVTVSDTESPTVDTPTSDISVNNDAGLCSAVVTYTAPTFADNCDGSGLAGTMTAGLASGSAFPVGVTTVTYEYTDAAGNGPVTSSFTVTVSDTESPTVDTPTSDISVNNDAGLCSALVTYTAPTFADNCDGSGLSGTMTAGLASGSAFPVGVTTVTYEYTDAAGNGPVTSSFTVTVSDTESPTVDTPTSDISVNNDAGLCSALVTYTAPTFADNCDGSGLSGTMTAGLASGSAFPVGVTTVTYEYTDAAGNGPVTSSFTVTVSDTESPTVETPTSDISVNNDAGLCSAVVTYTAPTFADNCDGSGLSGTMTAGLASGSAFPVGVTTVTYEYTDAAGNGPVTSSFTVTVSDTESPTVDTPTSDISVNNDAGLCSAVVTYTAPTFADNCDGSGLAGTMTAGLASGSAFPVGVTTVTYEYTDAAGNGPVTSSFTVTVSDTESPTVDTPTSDISVNNDAGLCSAVVTYTAPTFADNCDGSGLAGTMTAGLASGSAFPVGVTTVTYEYTDAAGNGPVTSSFTVTVSDTESPTVDTPTSDISVNNDAGLCSAVVTYTAPTFADNCDGSGLSGTMTAGLASGSAFPVGVTTVTYEYTDAAGNGPVTSSFTVTVSDTESPTVETPTSNISVNNDAGLCSAVVTYTAPTFADNCDGSGLAGTMTAGLASGSAFPVGVTTVTYEYTDAAGNGPVTSIFTVTVSDTESPTVDTPTSDISVNNDAGLCSAVVTYTAPTFADNCDGSGLSGTMTAGLASGSAFPVGVTTVTYEYTDAAGNGPVTSIFTVTVSDTESPTVDTPTSDISVNNDAGLCSAVVTYTAPTFADNCDGSGLSGTMTAGLASGSAFPVGVTTVTYEYTDAAGNGPVTSSFTVTVSDTVADS